MLAICSMKPTVDMCSDGGSHDLQHYQDEVEYNTMTIEERCSKCGSSIVHTLRWNLEYEYERCEADSCSGGGAHEWGNINDFESSNDMCGPGFIRKYFSDCDKCGRRRAETFVYEDTGCYPSSD